MNDVQMENKICYLLGDYNINILNYASHVHIVQFVDMMSSSGFLPLITRPTRVTATSSTLIDNIFTNYLEDIVIPFRGYSSLMYQIIFQFSMFQGECKCLMLILIYAEGYIPSEIRKSSVMLLAPLTGMKLIELQTPSRLLIYFIIDLLNCTIDISQRSG